MNTKEIRLVKPITANVNGQTFSLPAGRQIVQADVADHWFVKAHTDNDGRDEVEGDTRDLQIIELSTQNGQLRDALSRMEESARASSGNERKVGELDAQLQAMTAERDDLLKKNADLQATIDLSAPGETKPADSKKK